MHYTDIETFADEHGERLAAVNEIALGASNAQGLVTMEDPTMTIPIINHYKQQGLWTVYYNDRLAEFDAEVKALQFAVTVLNPAYSQLVLRLLEKYEPAGLEARAWRGAWIAAQGRVNLVQQPNTLVTVASIPSDNKVNAVYFIQFQEPGHYTCSCPDYQEQRAPLIELRDGDEQRLCKHVVACSMAIRLTAGYQVPELPPIERRPARAAISAGNGRNAAVRVNGDGRPVEDNSPPPATPQYANGEPVNEQDLVNYRTFVDAIRTAPWSQEKLTSWIMR